MPKLFQLTADEVRALRDLGPQLRDTEETIEALERIGLDVSEQRQRLEYAKRIREGFLKEFAPTGPPAEAKLRRQ